MSHSVRGTRKRITAGLVAGAVLASGLAALGASSAGAAQTVTVTRLSGANRYATAANVATNTYNPAVGSLGTRPRADVILASGENFPDGLAAAGLAGKVDAPVLLTSAASLPVETSNALAVLGATRVHVMGGTSVVSQSVRDQIAALGYTLVETYSGANRYDTAAKIATAIGAGSIGGFGGKRTAILATGTNYADALAAGSVSFNGVHPILLTDPASLSAETSAAITALGIQQVIIMGGTGAVSAAVADAITAKGVTVVRIAGDDRADTARDLATLLVTAPASGGFGFNKTGVVLFNGYDGFADGLSAGPRAGKAKVVALPVDDASVATPTNEFVTANIATINAITVIGGTSVISDATATAVQTAATVPSPTATISAAPGNDVVTVVFSEAISSGTFLAGDNDLAVTLSAGDAPETSAAVTNPSGDSKTFLVTMSGALETGDVVALVDNGASTTDGLVNIQTPSGVSVKTATFTVPADTVKPVVTLTAANGARAFTVNFSEPVTVAGRPVGGVTLVATNVDDLFPIAVGTSTTGTGAYAAAAAPADMQVSAGCGQTVLTCLISWTGGTDFKTGNTITIPAFTDLNGNVSTATSYTVVNDTIAPTVASAKGVNTPTAAASATVGGAGGLVLNAKAAGVGGNDITIQIDADAAYATTTISVVGTAIRANIPAAGVTGAALATSINGNAAASALVAATGGGTTINADSGPTNLAGGTTTTTITLNFSEAIGTLGAVGYDANGDGVAGPETATTAVTVPDADGSIAYTGSVVFTAGTSKLQLSGFKDLAGNTMSAVTVTITAA